MASFSKNLSPAKLWDRYLVPFFPLLLNFHQIIPQPFLCPFNAESSVGEESACNADLIPGSGWSPGEGIGYPLQYSWVSLVAQLVKNPPAMWENWVQSLGWEDPLEEGVATHSSVLAWRIPMERGTWGATVHGVAESQTQLSDFHFHFHVGVHRLSSFPLSSLKRTASVPGYTNPIWYASGSQISFSSPNLYS